MDCSDKQIINKMNIENGYVIPNKTNYINFINDDINGFIANFKKWLPELVEDGYTGLPKSQKTLKIYQLLVSNYLQENTPYRGLLLYHGLGAGKTAASITIAEGYINRKVMVLLPASIRETFKSEVNKFTIYNKQNYYWIYCTRNHENELMDYDKFNSDKSYRSKIDKYLFQMGIDKDIISKYEDDFIYNLDGKRYIGLWIPDLSKEGTNIDDITESDREVLNLQIKRRMDNKYNYYSYNGSNFLDNIIDTNLDYILEGNTDTKLVNKFQKLVKQKKKRSDKNELEFNDLLLNTFNNPFDNKTVIIDEVHNFISRIKNGSNMSSIIYLLLMKAHNLRLVCLSATPAINEPFELSILINLLNGYVRQYSIKLVYDENIDLNEIEQKIASEKTIDRYETLIKINRTTLSLTLIRNKKFFTNTKPCSEIEFKDGEIYAKDACVNIKKINTSDDCEFNGCNENKYIEYLKEQLGAKSVANVDMNMYSIFPDIAEKFHRNKLIITPDSIENAFNTFKNNYVKIINDKLIINNERDFIKRSLGSISYFEGIDIESMREQGIDIGYPSKKEYIMTSNLSAVQYEIYKKERDEEIQKDSKKRLMVDQDIPSSFRSTTRQTLLCIFNSDIMEKRKTLKSDKTISKEEKKILENEIIESISLEEIEKYSPKYNNVLNINNTSKGPSLLYSNYFTIEGLTALKKYMILSGYSELEFKKDKDINIEYYNNFITEFREDTDRLLGKMVIFSLDSNSKEYLEYCEKKFNIKNTDDFKAKISEIETLIDETDDNEKLIKIKNFLTKEDLWVRGVIEKVDRDSNSVSINYITTEQEFINIEDYQAGLEEDYKFNSFSIDKKIEDIYPATVVLFYSGLNMLTRQKYIAVFNDKQNKYGQYISSILATDVIAEGINLSYIRQINIINPYWNKVKTNQVIGRGTRMKSHIDLQEHQKHLDVYHHIMEFSASQIKYQTENRVLVIDKNLTTDQYLFNVGVVKEELINQFLKILKEVSIDCSINQAGDFMKKTPGIQCISELDNKIYGFRYNIFSYHVNNLIIDDNSNFLGMPTRKTYVDCKLSKYFIQNDLSFHIFNDRKFYYNFYKFIFSSSVSFDSKYIIKMPDMSYMNITNDISEMKVANHELKLWNWIDTLLLKTVDKLMDIEDTYNDRDKMIEYVYKILCNMGNPMINEHICNFFKFNYTGKIVKEPLISDLLKDDKADTESLCNKIKYEVIGKLYDLIVTELSDIIKIDNLDLIKEFIDSYRETDDYYEILLKLFRSNEIVL